MARILVAAAPLVALFLLLLPSPEPVSAATVGDIISSASRLFSRTDSSVAEERSLEAKHTEGAVESKDEALEGEKRHHEEQQPEIKHIPTVYTTRTEYIKVTSTKTQIPMCVTAYRPLPQCSKDPYDPLHPYESWRNARMTTSNEVSPEADALGKGRKMDEKSRELRKKENSKRSGRLMVGSLMNHLMRPLTLPLELIGLLPGPPTPPPPQLHLHVEFSPGLNPLDPNHPMHPNNPLHAANMVNLLNGGLVAAVGLADVITNGAGGGGGGGGGFGGGIGPEFGPSGFYNGVQVEVVREVNTITTYVTKTQGSYTATLTAGSCMPATDVIPHCKPTASYDNYPAYDPYVYQDVYYGMPDHPYDGYYVDPWSMSRGDPLGASVLDSAISPSTFSVVPETASQTTPPLKSQE